MKITFTIEDEEDAEGNLTGNAFVKTDGVVGNGKDATAAQRLALELAWLLVEVTGNSWDEIAMQVPNGNGGEVN